MFRTAPKTRHDQPNKSGDRTAGAPSPPGPRNCPARRMGRPAAAPDAARRGGTAAEGHAGAVGGGKVGQG